MAPKPQTSGGHVPPPRPSTLTGDKVVISGISGLFPGSDNVNQFSENLFNKVDMVTEEDLNVHHPEAPKHYGKINETTKFDAQFFKILRSHTIAMDPMSRKLLEQAYMAMYDSGINPLSLKGQKVSVFVGTSYSDICNALMFNTFKNKYNTLSGCAKSMFSNRISFWVDGKAQSLTIDSAHASSMVSLEKAYHAITNGHCDAAIVGGSNLCYKAELGINLRKSGMVCIDGKTKCFDRNSDGYVRAEAINCIFLQKSKDAKRVYAEVCYAKSSYGIRDNSSFSPKRQSKDIEDFLNNFYTEIDVSPKEVEYIEAEGAANAEADSNELEAISKVFGNDKPIKVGSVKSNMGHSEAVSGLCSITKVCLAYHHGKLPGNLHYSEPLDIPAVNDGRVVILDDNADFNRGYTAINNFCFTGVNCHVLLKGRFKAKDKSKYKCSIPRLVLISGRQESNVENIISLLDSRPLDPELIGMLHNIYKMDTPGHTGRGYTILDAEENYKTVNLGKGVAHYPGSKRPLWLVFSGMGSQWPGMAADLMRIPTFAKAIYRCHKALEPLGIDLMRVVTEPDKTIFDEILNCFIGISAVQIGLSDVLKEIGIVPDYIIGHSQGEMGAGYFDDCFTTEDMILSAYSRGIVSTKTKFIKGSMAAVGYGYKDHWFVLAVKDKIASASSEVPGALAAILGIIVTYQSYHQILPRCPPEIDVACHNSNESATLSGPADVMSQFVAKLTEEGIFAREVPSANIAFHSRYINHAGPELLERLKKILKEPRLRSEKWISTSVPEENWNATDAKYSSAEYHTNNLLSPVLFEEAARRIPNNATVVEVAPHGLLQAILKRSHPDCVHIPLTKRGQTDQVKFLLEAFGKIYQEGFDLKIDALYPKIEYPVSTETPSISPFVQWEHNEDTPSIFDGCQDKAVITPKREVIISVHDDEYTYFAGFVRNKNNVLPEAAILQLVWETLGMFLGLKYDKMSVVFKNVQFHGEVVMNLEESTKLTIMINRGNDYFEVCQKGILFANGFIANVTKISFDNIKEEEEEKAEILNENSTTILSSEDVYKSLHVNGLTYRGEFQSIHETNFNSTEARIKWRENWVTFLDSLIQLNILSRNYDGLPIPKIITKMTISIDDHNKIKEKMNEPFFNAKLYNLLGVTRCGGVEMRDIIFEDKPNKEQLPDALECKTFIPHDIVHEVNINTALQINLQLVADNIINEVIKVTEVTKESKSSLTDTIKSIAHLTPNVTFDVNYIDVDNARNAIEKTHVVIIDDTLLTETEIDGILDVAASDMFILRFYQKNTKFNNGQFNVLTSMTSQGKNIQLHRKISSNYCDAKYIPINSHHNFSWVPIVKNELQKTQRIVLVSERQPHCGLFGFVKKLNRDYNNKISLVIIDDYNAATFDKEKPVFKQQLQKKLTFNIFVKGQWGSYYYLPMSLPADVQNMKLINSKFGDIESLRWTEIPKLSATNNLVQVCYAGPTRKDSEKAVSTLESDDIGFGMDYSGFDSKGDRVMGIIPGGAITNTLQADPHLLWPVPEHWTLEEAATVPLPYVHAYYCLAIRGHLKRGMSVFVNGGTGALGQAIISISLSLGCKVYTTVSDGEKKQFLLKLFPQLNDNNIGHSQNGNFIYMVKMNTNGKNCDFVINCASGASREAAMNCTGSCGMFIDVSDYDSYHNAPVGMSFLQLEKSYCVANVSSIFKPPHLLEKKILQMIIAQGIANGTVRPLSRVVYPTTEVTRAFRLLSSSKHRGRVLIKIRDAEISKSLNIISRVACSSKGTYIVVCDKSELGIELANRLVKRGARKLLLHLKSKSVSGRLTTKLEAWSKLGASVKISTENLNTDKNCATILKEAKKMDSVKGIYIVQECCESSNSWTQDDFIEKNEKCTLPVAEMDILSRNNCPELSTFVVISRSSQNIVDEYITSVCDRICEARLAVGLPALSFRVELLDELHLDRKKERNFEPQNMITVLNALESSLKQKLSSSVSTFNLEAKNDKFSENVAKCLGISSIEDVDQNLTVADLVINEINIEEVKTLIENTYKVSYPVETLKNTPIHSLLQINGSKVLLNTNSDNVLGAFYSSVSDDVFKATDVMVPMRTYKFSCKNKYALDETEAHLILLPGFEGQCNIFETMCQRLKIQAMTFLIGPDYVTESIPDIASNILKYIKKTFVFKSKFYLLGYSFGVNVALEIAALLEKEGHVGLVYCLDSSPDTLKLQINANLGSLSENDLQNAIAEHMCQLMMGQKNEHLKEELERLRNWSDKVDMCISKLRGMVTLSTEYLKNVLDSAYNRILLAKSYTPNLKLESELVLIRGKPHADCDNYLREDYGLSKYSKKPVKVFDILADHATAHQDSRIPNIVNKLLDFELLEEFRNKNQCESYLV